MEIRKLIENTIRKYLNEIKQYAGHKIPTEDVFFHENPHKKFYNSELLKHIDVYIDDKTFEQNPIEWVDVNKIIPTQKFIDKANLNDVKGVGNNTGAYLVKYNDFYYVIDGHHRIANQIINGIDKIKAYVQEV